MHGHPFHHLRPPRIYMRVRLGGKVRTKLRTNRALCLPSHMFQGLMGKKALNTHTFPHAHESLTLNPKLSGVRSQDL